MLRVARDGALSTFFDSAELEVHALARAPGGGLYVGTSPDGRIYKVDAAGKSTPFFDPDDKYIWALAVDAKGIVYAATGDKGVIYRITPDGKGEVFYRTKATHVRTLFAAADGTVLAGTESPGRVFRVTSDGAGFLLLDSGLQEISALRPGPGGVVYAAALTGRGDERPELTDRRPRTVASDARAIGIDRDHVDVGGRAGKPDGRRAGRRGTRVGPRQRQRRRLSNPARWRLGPGVDLGRGRALRRGPRRPARCWWRPAARERSIASPATPRRRRC